MENILRAAQNVAQAYDVGYQAYQILSVAFTTAQSLDSPDPEFGGFAWGQVSQEYSK